MPKTSTPAGPACCGSRKRDGAGGSDASAVAHALAQKGDLTDSGRNRELIWVNSVSVLSGSQCYPWSRIANLTEAGG